MTLPDRVRREAEAALARLGAPDRIVSARPVGGGCIHHGSRIDTASGRACFLKWSASAPEGMFAAEADGLDALRAAAGDGNPGAHRAAGDRRPREGETATLVVPAPLAWEDGGDGPAWLLMEYVERGSAGAGSDALLGRGLAALHARGAEAARAEPFGWHRHNWIGSLPQDNDPDASWGRFWRDRRIAPQLDRARASGALRGEPFDRLLAVIADALADVDAPSLLHGDLWSGNAFFSAGGDPVLVDPAVYLGHGEVDLAMSELFGGFGPDFYAAYAEWGGLGDAYGAYRKSLYQLYYLLVHVNLFGGSYVGASRRAAEQVLAALR